MSDEKSKRQQRKDARTAAHKLKNDAAWTLNKSDPMQKLMELDQEARNEDVFLQAADCEACVEVRQSTQDESALCEEHLAEVMGF